jgi:hypothetical protein
MGIGFVLLLWLTFWMVVASVASIILGIGTSRLVKHAPKGPRARAVVAAVVLPPGVIVGAFLGFIVYGVWCETVRDIDPGIGDYGRAPLGSGYHFCMIDTFEQSYIENPIGKQIGSGMLRIGHDENTIYLETEPGKFLVIDKTTNTSYFPLSVGELEEKLRELGTSVVALHSPYTIYMRARWSRLDLLALPLVMGIPGILIILVVIYVRRVWRLIRKGTTEE